MPAGEKDRMLIEQISTRPTAEINGIIGGYTGEGAKTVIPGQATAKVSFRLVGEQNPEEDPRRLPRLRARAPAGRLQGRVRKLRRCAARSQLPFDNPALVKARAALADEWGKKAVTVGEGGSIPIVGDFKRVLGMDTIMVGFALDDDRVHSPNEKFDLTSASTRARAAGRGSWRRWRGSGAG